MAMVKPAAPILTPEQVELHRLGFDVPISEKAASAITGRSRKRLQFERGKKRGLRTWKDGRSVRYLLRECLDAATGKGA